jgi:squalene-associated FAD-dependent desaturase
VQADVVVIGGGFAGLSAAVTLADAGVRVMVLEQAPRLGGRAAAFVDRETGERVDNGQHVLFGCYRETYAFLDQLGTRQLAPLQKRLALTMAGADGRSFALRCPPLPPPWHLVGGLLRWRAVPLSDRLSVARLRPLLTAARRDGARAVAARVDPAMTVTEWLRLHGQSPRLCEWLWQPLAVAALNQAPDTAAAQPFVRVLAELFGTGIEDSAVGLPSVPLDELYALPAVRFIESRGGAVMTSAPARIVVGPAGTVESVHTPAATLSTRTVLSAVPWHGLARLWAPHVPSALQPLVASASAMAGCPIVTANLWFDGLALSNPFVGLIGGPMHWAFDKAALFGRPGSHLSVVASGAADLAAMDNAAVTRVAIDQLSAALPQIRRSRLLRSVVVREHRASFSLAPGGPARPQPETPLDGFFLAGDWTDTGLPATIEGAVVSGRAAAQLILARLRGGLPSAGTRS